MNPGDPVLFHCGNGAHPLAGKYVRESPSALDDRACSWVEYRSDDATFQVLVYDERIMALS